MNAITTTQAASGFSLMLSPATIEAAKELANTLSKSGLVPQAYAGKPEAILIAGAMGSRLGLDIFSSLAGIAVVNGRPTLWGDAMLAVCQSSAAWAGLSVAWDDSKDFGLTCTVTANRKGVPPVTGAFSVREAEESGLWGKAGPWKQYPRRMLEMRARAYALRNQFADVLMGFQGREEFEGMEDVTASATVHTDPPPARIRALPAGESKAEQPPVDKIVVVPEIQGGADAAADSATEASVATVADCIKAASEAFKTPAGKAALKEVLGAWKMEKVQDLGGATPDDRAEWIRALGIASKRIQGEQK